MDTKIIFRLIPITPETMERRKHAVNKHYVQRLLLEQRIAEFNKRQER